MRLHAGEVVVDRFEVVRQAGAGGMSLVYAAKDRTSGETIALKVLDGDRASVSRFVRETRVLSELHHPAVVRYVAHGSFKDGTPWLAMEWLDGEDLAQRLARAPLSIAETLVFATRVAEALGAAHARGVIHRDVKPANLFLPGGSIERVKVLDFGIARVTMGDLTATNSRVGTPAYMSPEQARGLPPPGPPSDVFSLGVVLHQALTGQRPFVGDDSMAVITRILLDDPPRVRETRADAPPELDELVWQMLAKKPEQRPADGEAVAARLRTIVAAPDGGDTPSLGPGEHRLTCLVLAREVGAERTPEIEKLAGGFGGRVETIADGSVAILLDGASVATDLTAQGARCALALRALAPEAPIALVTGRAISGARAPVGEVIDRAVALLRGRVERPERTTRPDKPALLPQVSPFDSHELTLATGTRTGEGAITAPFLRASEGAPAPILVDEVTAGLLDARFEVAGIGKHLALRGERDAIEVPRTLLGKPTAFIARDAELAALEAAFLACCEEGPRAVLVTAPPGIGKSRLRQELVRRLAARGPVEVLLGRGDPITAGAPFGILADAVRRVAGLADGDSDTAKRAKLRARIARHLPPEDALRVADFLGEMTGVRFPDEGRVELRAARADARLMGDQLRRAIEDWIAAECRAHPVVLALEDLHWGDAPTVETVDAMLRNLADLPLLVVATARPEIAELFPNLWGSRGLTELRLPELSKRAAERLVAAALGKDADAALIARVVERAGGNALYLEEAVRSAAEGKDDTTPSTLIAMVQSRLERMEADARRLLRAGAVFGETFAAAGVAHLLGDNLDPAPWLGALVEREVIARRGGEYAFRHGLVRDAAYAMLTPDDRVLGHRLAAAWLESNGEQDPIRLAEHHERGGASEHAVTWWLRAAEQALAASDLAAVLGHVARAIGCGGAGETLGALSLLAAEAHEWRGEFPDAARTARDAMRWLSTGTPRWFAAAAVAATAAGVQGHGRELIAVADEVDAALGDADADPMAFAAARLAEQLIICGHLDRADALLARIHAPGPGAAGRVQSVLALRARYGGDVAGNLAAVEGAVARFAATGDRRNLCVHRERLGYARLELGDAAGAETLLRESLASAQQLGLRNVAATARHNLGLALARLGRSDEAARVEQEAIADFTASGNRRMRGASLEYLALIHLAAGDARAAETAARAAVDVASISPALPLNQAESWAILARALLAQGRSFDALEVADHAIAMLERLGGIDDGEAIILLAHAEALAAVGAGPSARVAIERARDRLLERADRIRDDRLRAGFLAGVPENRRTLELCDARAQEGS